MASLANLGTMGRFNMKKFVTGIVPPVVTPLSKPDTLDVNGLDRLVEHLLGGGVNGLFFLGTCGEGPSLARLVRNQVVTRVTQQVDGRVPVLVGVTDSAFGETVEMARFAAAYGADAVVLAPPYYFPAGQPELREYLEHILDVLPLPVFLYNMPSHTKLVLEIETIRTVLHHPRLVGIKDSSGDLNYFARLLELRKERPELSILIGPEHFLLRSLEMGSDGGVCGGANVFPDLFVKLVAAYRAGDAARVKQCQQKVDALQGLFAIGRHSSAVIKGIKSALHCLEICSDEMAEPFRKFNDPEKMQVAELLLKLSQMAP